MSTSEPPSTCIYRYDGARDARGTCADAYSPPSRAGNARAAAATAGDGPYGWMETAAVDRARATTRERRAGRRCDETDDVERIVRA